MSPDEQAERLRDEQRRAQAAAGIEREEQARQERFAAADQAQAERLFEHPELGLLVLALGPLLPAWWLLRRLRRRPVTELRHEQLRFRFHDWAVAHPEAALVLQLGAALVGAAGIALAAGMLVLLAVWVRQRLW